MIPAGPQGGLGAGHSQLYSGLGWAPKGRGKLDLGMQLPSGCWPLWKPYSLARTLEPSVRASFKSPVFTHGGSGTVLRGQEEDEHGSYLPVLLSRELGEQTNYNMQ